MGRKSITLKEPLFAQGVLRGLALNPSAPSHLMCVWGQLIVPLGVSVASSQI